MAVVQASLTHYKYTKQGRPHHVDASTHARPPYGQGWRVVAWRVVGIRDSEDVHFGDRRPGRSSGYGEAELGLRGRRQVVWRGVCQFDYGERKREGCG